MADKLRRLLRPGLMLPEAAIILPLVVLLTLGILEYGWLFVRLQQVTHAARHGARIAATVDATNSEVTAAVESWMNSVGMGLSNVGYELSFSPADVSTVAAGETLTVRVAVVYSRIGLGTPMPVPAILRGRVSMAKEGA